MYAALLHRRLPYYLCRYPVECWYQAGICEERLAYRTVHIRTAALGLVYCDQQFPKEGLYTHYLQACGFARTLSRRVRGLRFGSVTVWVTRNLHPALILIM